MKKQLTVSVLALCLTWAGVSTVVGQSAAPAQRQVAPLADYSENQIPEAALRQANTPVLQQVQQQTGFLLPTAGKLTAARQKLDEQPTQRMALEAFAAQLDLEYRGQQALLKQRPELPLVGRTENIHGTAEFKRLVPGRAPEYYRTHNAQGAATISTDKVWPNGILGFNLAGQQMIVGEWDGGAVRTTHEAFGGRATVMDGSTTISDHATHVGATMVGGTTNAQAKGMAYMANLNSYDWNNDDAEMALAAANGLLVSNHSYGMITGWAFGDFGGFGTNEWYWFGEQVDTKDRSFGRYALQSSRWDSIARLAPNYLIVKSAGNDRGNGPAAGTSHRVWNGSAWIISTTTREVAGGTTGYDCISHGGVAKNVLTVGAVDGITGGYLQPSQVVASSFHGWGPTDDGRIKPDIVAKGVAVFSATSAGNNTYGNKNGTSMASPMVAGSLTLLQQLYRQQNGGTPLKAATLKALVIHTADEAGPQPGPDYTFGWGLMNTGKAAEVIANAGNSHQLVEASLNQGATYTLQVNSNGSQPLRVTIAWTDRAAPESPYVLNGSTKALINDLDVRVIRNLDSTQTLPWTLGGLTNPSAAAIRADNDRDNVEQVLVNNPTPGSYTIRVTHKGSLSGGAQAFGMAISGVSPQQVMRQVTFKVDMTGQTVSPLGVRIAGNFQGWDPAATAMTNAGGNIWEYTTNLPEGDTIQYKFVNGNAWGSDEGSLPASCVFPGTTNRWLVVPASNTVLPAYLYNQCVPASTGPVAVTFRVDMTGLSVSGSGVHIAGSFQGWNPAGTPMTPVANNIWEYTTNLLPGTTVEYKFVNGNDWSGGENAIPSSCSVLPSGNRSFTVPGLATVLPAVLFNQCSTSAPATIAMTFRVDMRAQVIRPQGVHIAGNFQGWNPVPMQADPLNPGYFTFTSNVTVGDSIEWKFINGDSWGFFDTISQTFVDYSESVPLACQASGGPNRFVIAPNTATVLPVYIFGSCNTANNMPFVETFANGIPAGWTQNGGTYVSGSLIPDPDARFEYRGAATTPNLTVGSRGAYAGASLPIQSPTRLNGFVIFDSDFLDNNGVAGAFGTGSSASPHYAELVSPVMNLSAISFPILRFNQFHRKFAGIDGRPTATYVVFSRDGGTTWPDSIALNPQLLQNGQTPANEQVSLYLSAQLGGAAQARMKFLFWGDYYFWMLDDIHIESAPATDVSAFNPIVRTNQISGTQYPMVPVHMQQGATFSVNIRNQGGNTLSSVQAVADVRYNGNSVFNQAASIQGPLAFGQFGTANLNDPFASNQTGLYLVRMGAAPLAGDAYPANDLVDAPLFITDSVYALDRGSFANYGFLGTNSFTNNGSRDGMQFGNRFDVPLPAIRASSATILLAPGTSAGAEVLVYLYPANDLFSPLAMSNPYTITAADVQNGQVTIGIPPIVLPQGSYYLVVESYTNNGASTLNIRDDLGIPQPTDASMIYLPNPGNWFSNGNAFAIRLNGVSPASQQPMVNVTFRVNMTRYPVDSVGVHLAGSFQGWMPNSTTMSQISPGIWQIQTQVPANDTIEYKFINGNSWGRDEQNWLKGCGTGNGFGSENRMAIIGSTDTILPLVFFNSCATTLQELTVADLQVVPEYLYNTPQNPSRTSRYNGQVVTVEGVVAGGFQQSVLSSTFKSAYLQMQVPFGPWFQYHAPRNTGINVRLLAGGLVDSNLLVPGNRVRITGLVSEFPTNNVVNSETQLDISTAGNVVLLSANDTFRAYKSNFWEFTYLNNNLPEQNAYGENYEGSYLLFENLVVTQVNQFSAGRFELTLRDEFNNVLKTRDASRVLRAPLFSPTDSTAAVHVKVGDTLNLQGFMQEVITAGVPEFRIAPWYVSDFLPATGFSNNCSANLQALGSTNICMNEQVELEVNSITAIQDVRWTIDGIPYPEANGSLSIFARVSGLYQAEVTFVGGCVSNTNPIDIEVTVPHQAFVQVNGPLHFAQGQNVATSFAAVPQLQLRATDGSGGTLANFAFRPMLASDGWNNVPQGAAAVFNGLVHMPADSLACGPLPAGSLQGKVALLFRGTCAISDKALNAQRAGAIAVLVVNNLRNAFVPNFITNPLTGDSVNIPVMSISWEDGRKLRERFVNGVATTVEHAPAPNAQYAYQWFRNEQPEIGATSPTFTATQTGDYQLQVTTGGNCAFRSAYYPVSQSNFAQSPWVLQNLNQPIADITVRNIEPIDANTAWTLEERGEGISFNIWYYRTTNGGMNWQAGQIPNTGGMGTSHIMALDAQTAFVTLYGDSLRQGVYKTADGGQSWLRLPVFQNGGFPNFTHFWDTNTGIAAGDPMNGIWQLYRTTNGGNSWSLVSTLPAPMQNEFGTTAELSVNQAGELVWASSTGRFFRTSDQGLSWQAYSLPESGQARMAWGESGLGVVYFAATARLYYTENHGNTWLPMERAYGGMRTITSMTMVPGAQPQTLVVSGPLGTAYAIHNQGWGNIDGIFHSAVKFVSPTVGWSGGISGNAGLGGVFKWNSNFFGSAPAFGSISGQLLYSNVAQSPMSNSFVAIYDAQSGNLVRLEATNAAGEFNSQQLPVGDYVLRGATNKQPGGVNATDALRAARHFTGLSPLSGMWLEAADVNDNGIVNSTDALQIAQRFAGLLNNPMALRIYFDALLGGNLANASSIHMHSGASVDPNQVWQYVVGNWGDPTSPGLMTAEGNGRWMIGMNPIAYYNQAPNGPMPAGSTIQNIGMVFRESGPCTNCLEQKDGSNQDIFLYPTMNPPVSTYLGVKATQSGLNGFGAGNWLFSTQAVQVTANTNQTVVLHAIATGDVDGSFNPSLARLASSVKLENEGKVEVVGGQQIRVPVRIREGVHLGAMSLAFTYNTQKVRATGVKFADASIQANAQLHLQGGEIRISWFDLAGKVVTNEELLFDLEFQLLQGEQHDLGISLLAESEMADVRAMRLSQSVLLLPGAVSSLPSETGGVLALKNYPNPFQGETMLDFQLPVSANVNLTITDTRGRIVRVTELGEMQAGSHQHRFDAGALRAGVYFCELRAQGQNITEQAIIRLMIH